MKYDHKQVEKKWQDIWDEKQCFKAENGSDKEKFYALGTPIHRVEAVVTTKQPRPAEEKPEPDEAGE